MELNQMCHFFSSVGSNCLQDSNEHQLKNTKKKRTSCGVHKAQWVLFCGALFTFCTSTLQRVRVLGTDWQFGVIFVADYCLHVLRHHAKQVGPADLSAWLHEEPPGLPPRPPCTSVAFLQLHVHARRVSSWLLRYWFRENSGYLQLMAHEDQCWQF